MKRRALVLCIGLLVSISALAYSGGSGTEQNPYLISSKADMEQLSSYVNGGQAYSGIYFKLTQDLTGITTMAGNSNSRYFSGIFDGDGHTLEVNISSTGSYAGVFGYTDGATIKNLGVEGSVTRPAQARDAFVGGICGYAKNTMISNCYNAGTISSSTSYYASFSGGICGECVTGNFIDNCYNIGDISSSGGSDNTYSGGICGDGGTITTCYNTGDISSSSSSYSYSGGICGVMGTIKNCFVADCVISNDKYIDATRTRIGRIGGFGGGGTYTNCYASGDVKLNGDPIGSSDADSKDGKDATLSSFQNQSWIQTNLGWDFQTIWEMSSENGGLPVLKKQGQSQHYTITASAGGGGNILPNGEVSVPSGGSQTFTFTPLSGYEIDQVLVDGANNASAVSVGSYTFSNVTANHSIAVSFKQNQPQTYIIAASAESGGNISPNGNIFITSGGSQTFTFTPLSGYEIDQVLVDSVNNASAISAGSYTFSNVTTNHSITVSFTQTQPQVYTITASAGAGGNVSPSGNVSITSGGSQTFTFTPLSSYKVEQVLIDGANNAPAAAAGSYTFSNVTANHSIAVSFKQNQQQTYIIAASAGTGGDISPSGNISVTSGDSQTFTFTPLSSYKVEQVLIDGVNNAPAAAAGSYTFSNVTANHSIAVSFKQNQQQTYIIAASAGTGGEISPSGNISVTSGGSQTFTFTPLSSYKVDQVLIDGANNAPAAAAGSYTFSNVTTNHSIVVSFKQNQQQTYIIAASAGTGGNISPSGNISITSGGSQTFTFTPLSSYEVDQVLIDGANNPSAVVAGSYTFSNVTANHSIVVSFKQNQQQTYIITASAGSGGNISPSGNVFVNAGGSQTFTFSPLFSYEIDQVLIDGANNPSAVVAGSYTFSNVTANHSIAVSFKQNQPQTYIIAASAESGGNISPNGNIFITSGGSQTFTFSPLFSYEIDQVLIDGANNASAVSARYYTFSNVTANHSIAVSFKQKQDFSGGSGTQQNPYLISSRADMERLATNVNGGQNYSGVYFGLTRDLTGVNDVTTTVVGKSYSHYFSGIFDGSGHTLKVNLYGAAGSEAYVGVFGYTNGATIKNLGVGGDIIQLENTGVAYVGGICGRAENTVISNCYNTGNISSSASSNGSYSGGICGLASAYNSSMSISDCYNAGNISAAASSDAVASYHSWSGGICGYVADNGSISISDCYNTGNISVAASSGESSSGGICGYVSQHSSISNCYNTGNIYSSSSHSWSGGICGYGSGNIQNCFVANCQIKAATSTRISDRGIYNCYADKNITLNGVTASSNDANSRDGKDATLANFQTQSWIQANLQWNFQTEWEMSNMNDPVHKGLPILRGIDNGVGIPVVRPNESVLVDVFPNPAKNELFFTSDHSIEKVEIYTQSGILALTDKAPGGKIDVSRLAAGVYFVRVYVNGGVEIRKVIVGG